LEKGLGFVWKREIFGFRNWPIYLDNFLRKGLGFLRGAKQGLVGGRKLIPNGKEVKEGLVLEFFKRASLLGGAF